MVEYEVMKSQRGSRKEMPCMPALFLTAEAVRRRADAMALSGVPVAASFLSRLRSSVDQSLCRLRRA
jgi:hypothetical protein